MAKIKEYIAGLALAWDLLKQPFQNYHKVSNWCPSEAERNDKGTNPSMIYLTEKDKELLKAMKEAKEVKPNLMPLPRPPATHHAVSIGYKMEYESQIKVEIKKKIKEIEQEEDYATALKKLKDLTAEVMLVYNGKKNMEIGEYKIPVGLLGNKMNRQNRKDRRELIGMLGIVAARIQEKMNRLDRENPLEWKRPKPERRIQSRKVTRSA